MSNARSVSGIFAFLGCLLPSACGDSKTPVKPQPDSGPDAAIGETTSAESGPSSDAASDDAAVNPCPDIASACAGKDDVDGLGNLCLRVASKGSASACEAVAVECSNHCAADSGSTVDTGELTVEQCKDMGDTCHDFDTGIGLGNLCHEVGHTGNLAWCAAIYDDCVALCGEPTSHEADAGARTTLELRFAAKVGDEDFECGREYANVGASRSTITPVDLRFYVSNIRLLTDEGEQVPAVIDDVGDLQGGGVALLDFNDGSGACSSNDSTTNTSVRITVPAGNYSGVAFSTSVPLELNHRDPVTLSAPLQAGDMGWGWTAGFKFIKLELQTVNTPVPDDDGDGDASATEPIQSLDAGGDAGSSDGGTEQALSVDASSTTSASPAATGPIMTLLHVGSVACSSVESSNDASAGDEIACAKGNRNDVAFSGVDLSQDVFVLDVAQVVANTDLSDSVFCHPGGPSCAPIFEAVGINYEAGAALETHPAFRVQ